MGVEGRQVVEIGISHECRATADTAPRECPSLSLSSSSMLHPMLWGLGARPSMARHDARQRRLWWRGGGRHASRQGRPDGAWGRTTSTAIASGRPVWARRRPACEASTRKRSTDAATNAMPSLVQAMHSHPPPSPSTAARPATPPPTEAAESRRSGEEGGEEAAAGRQRGEREGRWRRGREREGGGLGFPRVGGWGFTGWVVGGGVWKTASGWFL